VISLDGFRAINEEYGHIIGDALLVEVGAALEREVGDGGVTGRLAGDTFGAFLTGVGTQDDARHRLGVLQGVFTRPFSTGDRDGTEFIPVSATIGAAVARSADEKFDLLLSHADTAVLAAKRLGHGRLELFAAGMESEATSRARTSTEISRAIEGGEFELYFQPHLDVQTMAVSGAEALIRWHHPKRGVVLPNAFIPFAEQHGLIRPISQWVMGAALTASARLRDCNPAFRLYFNLSGVDFSDGAIVDELREAGRHGANLANVGVELTETAAMADLGAAARSLRHLQELGVTVAIDDFGTGYSGLALLKRLPVNLIKIDRSFINEVLLGKRDAAITESVIRNGEQLGYETVGEGVESVEQLEWLRGRGCRYVQGFAVARPQPLDGFVDWLANHTPPKRVA
jgi:diguanylate cyclase (GGDEF)-like protein